MHMTWIDADAIRRVTTYPALCDALDAGHRAGVDDLGRVVLSQPSPTQDGMTNAFLCLPAWQRGEALGAKVCTVFPENGERGLDVPAIQAVYLLFDGMDGRPLAAIDATEMTYWKTAAVSAQGSRFLSRPDVETLVMLGAGGLGPHVIAAHRAVRPSIKRVIVWNRTHAKAVALAEAVGGEAWEDRDAAVAEADIVAAATNATEPLIAGAHLKDGCHVDLIGSYTPDMREADDEAVRRARVFCDDRRGSLAESGDFIQPIASGAMTEADVLADYFELARGAHPGRETDTEITLCKNIGGGHLDLMAARYLLSAVA
jgi:alanine dehydrogenase